MADDQPRKPQRPYDDEKYRAMRNAGIGLTIPMMLAASILVGCLVGYYLDRWLHTTPWLFLVFFILGIVTGIRETILLIRKLNDAQK